MPAPSKAPTQDEKKAPPKVEPEASEPEERSAPPAKNPSDPKAKVPKEAGKPPVPKLPELRPREWFDHILPDNTGAGFLGYFSREKPSVTPKEE